jgi:shikimate kinase
MNNNLILVGIPNCGKTTLGRAVAAMLGLRFFDTDELAYKRLNLADPVDIFRLSNMSLFVRAQTAVMKKLSKTARRSIISTGAECGLQPEVVRVMREIGGIVHIKRDAKIILDELRRSDKSHVVFKSDDGHEIDMNEMAVIEYQKEEKAYEAIADFTLENNGDEKEGAEKLAEMVRAYFESVSKE